MWQVPTDPYRFDAGVAWFRDRVPLPDHEWQKLSLEARSKSFKVAGVAQADMVTDVWKSLDRAIENGTTLEDFKADVAEKLTAAWGGANPARVETIFRTNLQLAYSAGRQAQMLDPDIVEDRPFRRFVATLDTSTSPTCRALHNTVLAAADPFWVSHEPPLHHRCRSTVVTLTPEEAEELGLTKKPAQVEAEDGFGNPLVEWNPDLSKYPAPLAETLAASLGAGPGGTGGGAPPQTPAPPPVQHTRAHWFNFYTADGYKAEAAKSLAWARAAQERSLDALATDVLAELKTTLSPEHADLFDPVLRAVTGLGTQQRWTLRDLIAAPHTTPREREQLLAVAALHGHAKGVAGSKTAPPFKPRRSRTPSVQQLADKIVANATERLSAYLSNSAAPPPVRITWTTGRGYERNGAVWVSASPSTLVGLTLEHEFGHAIEEKSPPRLLAAAQFIQKRTAGEPLRSLRSLTGRGYSRTELTRKDKFWDPYVGKAYGHGSSVYGSEVTSMGLQWLLNRDRVSQFYEADPEHFLFTLGQLAPR